MAEKELFGISEQLDCSDCVDHGGDWECDHVHCRKGADTISRVVESVPSAQPSAADICVGGNLIDRQAAIDAMMKLQTEDIEAYGASIPEGFDGDRAVTALKALPSAQQWISCKERLPEKDGEYLVTMLYFGEKTVEVDKFSHYETDDEHNGEPFWMYGYDNVIAWMPRPEAWKGDKHGTSRAVLSQKPVR